MSRARIAIVTGNAPPEDSAGLKYTRLGPIGIAAARAYATRHGYGFSGTLPDVGVRPACWAKIPALLAALESHDWAVWVDSDAVALAPARDLAPLLATDADIVAQDPDAFFADLGLDPVLGRASQPLHTCVFALCAGGFARDLLAAAWEETQFVKPAAPWNGIGEQEAINAVLKRRPPAPGRIRYVGDLQAPPRLASPTTRFVHFYGDRAAPLVPEATAARVLDAFEDAVRAGRGRAMDLGLVHLCAIQRSAPGGPIDRGGPERFGYDAAALRAAARAFLAEAAA
ncbi:hypothetical protein [Salinarimonas rosea]|uniref:hypothetical protein n=1 Tax=Salinarimonas rosea TaxID=552063 RepID=UPI00040B16F5|nr:hypothetical protein [Salinarimonas rosea]